MGSCPWRSPLVHRRSVSSTSDLSCHLPCESLSTRQAGTDSWDCLHTMFSCFSPSPNGSHFHGQETEGLFLPNPGLSSLRLWAVQLQKGLSLSCCLRFLQIKGSFSVRWKRTLHGGCLCDVMKSWTWGRGGGGETKQK